MISFFWGDEDFDIETAVEQQKKKLDKTFSAINFKTLDNPPFADLIAAVRTQPMMFGKMLIVIKCEKYFSKDFSDSELKEIDTSLEINPETLDIIFVATYDRNDGKKPDSRKKIFKILSKHNMKEFASIKTYKTAEITARVEKMAKSKDLKIEPKAMTVLIEQLGNTMRDFDRELEKLFLLAYPKNIITAEMVKKNCISNEDLFEFMNFVMQGEKGKALLEFRQLLQKTNILKLVLTLQTFLRKWITIKLKSSAMTAFEIGILTGQHEFIVKKTQQALAKTQLKDLVALKQNLLEAEYRLKSGKTLNEIEEFENAILR